MDSASFDEVWKVAKNGYNKSHDAHFRRFHTDFLAHSSPSNFTPTGIQPGDLVGFLRREREKGAAHPSLKDAAASVSTAQSPHPSIHRQHTISFRDRWV